MDAHRFDGFARQLAHGSTRRSALAALSVGLLVASPLALGRDGIAAKKGKGKGKGKKKGCKSNQKRCGSKCVPKGGCCDNNECDQCRREFCENGQCVCSPGTIESNGRCGFFTPCKSVGLLCASDSECCSGSCLNLPGGNRCDRGTSLCLTDFDCVSGPCRGFVCPELRPGCPG